MTITQAPRLKLNYKRTMLIGFAFFGILLLWQVYDTWCPPFLTDIFARQMYGLSSASLKEASPEKNLEVQWIVGIIMACDNLAALILLPIFGSLSDKTKTPIGKRMPYILVGTFVSALAFPFIPLFFHFNNVACMIAMMAVVLIFMMIYRNPAVSLMPDITPKPLRAKANGIINIMGYFGGAFAAVMAMGIFLAPSKYIDAADRAGQIWIIEAPFLIASVLMVISALILFFTIRENKLTEELKDEMALGEELAAIENPVTDDAPMTKANRRMLIAILGAEFLWFMSDNALGTYLSNYVEYYLNAPSVGLLVIVGGLASVVGFAIAGIIADKIGRKWTISMGLFITILAIAIMCFVKPSGVTVLDNKGNPTALEKLPTMLYAVWAIKGFGMALVHNCSFPMVVELCSSKKIGKFTGFYYASSMAAQTITPVLLGFIFKASKKWQAMPIYCAVLLVLSCAVFTFLVKNIKAKKLTNAHGIEALGGDD